MKKLLCMAALMGTVVVSHIAVAAQPVTIVGMLMHPSASSSAFVFMLSDKTDNKVSYQPNPDRVMVEFANAKPKFVMHNARLGGANVSKIDTQVMPNGAFQYIFYVSGKPAWKTDYLPTQQGENGIRFEVTITSAVAKK